MNFSLNHLLIKGTLRMEKARGDEAGSPSGREVCACLRGTRMHGKSMGVGRRLGFKSQLPSFHAGQLWWSFLLLL